MDIKVNYKNKKHYNTARYPIRQPLFFTGLIWTLSKIMLTGKKKKVEKINMEGLKPPYMMLSNHMSFIDFELAALGTFPHRVNNVVNIDGYYKRPWLMEWIGAICTRKFTMDLHLIKSISHVFKKGDILGLYPEARYSPDGTTSYIPPSVAMLIKKNCVPVVAVVHRGNYLRAPFWGYHVKRKVPFHTTLTQVLTKEDIERMSVDEIYEVVKEALTYDDYKYQRDNGIVIDEPRRAEGLHKILYKCPACKKERMASNGAKIYCEECHKSWLMETDGTLTASDGQTEFSYVPDWFRWQREEIREEILRGEYSYSDEVEVYSMPRCYKFEPLGRATLTHNEKDGFVLTGHYRGEDYRIQRMPLQTNSLHVEYDFPHVKPMADCVDISTETDSFYCYPTQYNVSTKLSLATEEIYKLTLEKHRPGSK